MKFTMNGVEYTIKEVSQEEYKKYRIEEDKKNQIEITNDINTGVFFGASHQYVNVIFLDKALPFDRKRRVLTHELTHCYIAEYITHEDKTFSEEDVAEIAANSHDVVHQIVEDYFLDKKNKI